MPYLSIDDDEFWDVPEPLKEIQATRREAWDAKPAGTSKVLDLLRSYRSTQFILGDAEDTTSPSANVIEMPPGLAVPHHTHDCDVFMLVLRGSLYVPGKVLRPGDAMTARAHEFYGPEVAGPEGCTRAEFFGQMKHMLELRYRWPDGQMSRVYTVREPGPRFRDLGGMEALAELKAQVEADGRALSA